MLSTLLVWGDLLSCRGNEPAPAADRSLFRHGRGDFSIFAGGVWLIAQRLTTEATLQTAVLMARQVEIALADSLRQRPAPQGRIVQSQPSSSFWSFLGNIFPGVGSKPKTQYIPGRPAPRHAEVKGLMDAFVNRSGSIEAMWVINADGKILYSSMGHEKGEALTDSNLRSSLRRGVTSINSQRQGKSTYYDVLVPLQMPPAWRDRAVSGCGSIPPTGRRCYLGYGANSRCYSPSVVGWLY